MVVNNTPINNGYYTKVDNKEMQNMQQDKQKNEAKLSLEKAIFNKEMEKMELERQINELSVGRLLDILV